MQQDIAARIQFIEPVGKFVERDQFCPVFAEVCDLPFERLAYIDELNVFFAVELRLQLLDCNFRDLSAWSFCTLVFTPQNSS